MTESFWDGINTTLVVMGIAVVVVLGGGMIYECCHQKPRDRAPEEKGGFPLARLLRRRKKETQDVEAGATIDRTGRNGSIAA
jgi:hypothetical protein